MQYRYRTFSRRWAFRPYFGPGWWFTLHMIQTPMIGLVAIGLWLMVDPIDDSTGAADLALA